MQLLEACRSQLCTGKSIGPSSEGFVPHRPSRPHPLESLGPRGELEIIKEAAKGWRVRAVNAVGRRLWALVVLARAERRCRQHLGGAKLAHYAGED